MRLLLFVVVVLFAGTFAKGGFKMHHSECGVRIRQAWKRLSAVQQKSFFQTIELLKNTAIPWSKKNPGIGKKSIYGQFVSVHASALNWDTAHGSQHKWGSAVFLQWHRWYLYRFETELRKAASRYNKLKGKPVLDPCVTLPYWNWEDDLKNSKKSGVLLKHLFGEAKQPPADPTSGLRCIKDSFMRKWKTSGDMEGFETCIYRNFDTKTFGIGRMEVARVIMDYPAWGTRDDKQFRRMMEGRIHVEAHSAVGGLMSRVNSPEDAIFWLHHTNIDRIMAIWQDCHNYDKIPSLKLHTSKKAFDFVRAKDDTFTVNLDKQLPYFTLAGEEEEKVRPDIMGPPITARKLHSIVDLGYRYGVDTVVELIRKIQGLPKAKRICKFHNWVDQKLPGKPGKVCCRGRCDPVSETKKCCARKEIYNKAKNSCVKVSKKCCLGKCGPTETKKCCVGNAKYSKGHNECIVLRCCTGACTPERETNRCCNHLNYYSRGSCSHKKSCCRGKCGARETKRCCKGLTKIGGICTRKLSCCRGRCDPKTETTTCCDPREEFKKGKCQRRKGCCRHACIKGRHSKICCSSSKYFKSSGGGFVMGVCRSKKCCKNSCGSTETKKCCRGFEKSTSGKVATCKPKKAACCIGRCNANSKTCCSKKRFYRYGHCFNRKSCCSGTCGKTETNKCCRGFEKQGKLCKEKLRCCRGKCERGESKTCCTGYKKMYGMCIKATCCKGYCSMTETKTCCKGYKKKGSRCEKKASSGGGFGGFGSSLTKTVNKNKSLKKLIDNDEIADYARKLIAKGLTTAKLIAKLAFKECKSKKAGPISKTTLKTFRLDKSSTKRFCDRCSTKRCKCKVICLTTCFARMGANGASLCEHICRSRCRYNTKNVFG